MRLTLFFVLTVVYTICLDVFFNNLLCKLFDFVTVRKVCVLFFV